MPNIQELKQSDEKSRAVRTADSLTEVEAFFKKNADQLRMALPKHLNSDRITRLALTSLSQNPDLRKCTLRSVFGEVIKSSQLGLEIGVLGQGYLVPFFNTQKGVHEAQFIPGWRGLVDLVARAGRASAWTGAVFEGDEFDYALGDKPFITHRPHGEDDPKKITHVYAVGRVNGSEWPIIEVWPIVRVMKHRDKNNKVGQRHYSFKNWEMYARKIPLLQVLKYLPMSVELTQALQAEAALGEGFTIDGDFTAVEPDQPVERDVTDHDAGRGGPPPALPNDAQPPTYFEIESAMKNARSVDELNAAANMLGAVPDDESVELANLYEARLAEFQPAPAPSRSRNRAID
jgi:recombination protein RecT